MTIKKLVLATLLTLTAFTGTAFARGGKKAPPPQTHHCKMPDGTTDLKKTKKQCTKAKGSWAKDEATAPTTPTTPTAPTTPTTPPATK